MKMTTKSKRENEDEGTMKRRGRKSKDIINSAEIKRQYTEQLYSNRLVNLGEINNFLGTMKTYPFRSRTDLSPIRRVNQ